MTPEDFADYPRSVNELRGTDNAADWTPREALVSLLRDIDSGVVENIDAVVICYRHKGDKPGATRTHFVNAGPDVHVAMGMMEVVKFQMMEGE